MNLKVISLQSANTSTIETLELVELYDHTKITLNLDNIYDGTIPVFVKIDWGDGDSITIDNDIFNYPDRINLNIFNPNPILTTPYSHEYYPSKNSLYLFLTLQVLIYYSDSNYNLFTIPIQIRTNDFFEAIEDIKLIGVNILPYSYNPKQYQLKASVNQQIIEIVDTY
jgi:hypothetical protein